MHRAREEREGGREGERDGRRKEQGEREREREKVYTQCIHLVPAESLSGVVDGGGAAGSGFGGLFPGSGAGFFLRGAGAAGLPRNAGNWRERERRKELVQTCLCTSGTWGGGLILIDL